MNNSDLIRYVDALWCRYVPKTAVVVRDDYGRRLCYESDEQMRRELLAAGFRSLSDILKHLGLFEAWVAAKSPCFDEFVSWWCVASAPFRISNE